MIKGTFTVKTREEQLAKLRAARDKRSAFLMHSLLALIESDRPLDISEAGQAKAHERRAAGIGLAEGLLYNDTEIKLLETVYRLKLEKRLDDSLRGWITNDELAVNMDDLMKIVIDDLAKHGVNP